MIEQQKSNFSVIDFGKLIEGKDLFLYRLVKERVNELLLKDDLLNLKKFLKETIEIYDEKHIFWWFFTMSVSEKIHQSWWKGKQNLAYEFYYSIKDLSLPKYFNIYIEREIDYLVSLK